MTACLPICLLSFSLVCSSPCLLVCSPSLGDPLKCNEEPENGLLTGLKQLPSLSPSLLGLDLEALRPSEMANEMLHLFGFPQTQSELEKALEQPE